MSYPMAIVRRRIQQMMADLGLNLSREALLGWGTRRVVDTSIGKKRSSQRGLNIRTHEAAIQVVLIKTKPDMSAELLSLSQAKDVSSRSVFKRTAGRESTLGHANAGKAPIVIGKRRLKKRFICSVVSSYCSRCKKIMHTCKLAHSRALALELRTLSHEP